MAADRDRVTRRALGWAVGLAVVLYALLWVTVGPPPAAAGAGPPAITSVPAVRNGP
jgi:hypothetical protein